jgi:hypothetical protein
MREKPTVDPVRIDPVMASVAWWGAREMVQMNLLDLQISNGSSCANTCNTTQPTDGCALARWLRGVKIFTDAQDTA